MDSIPFFSPWSAPAKLELYCHFESYCRVGGPCGLVAWVGLLPSTRLVYLPMSTALGDAVGRQAITFPS